MKGRDSFGPLVTLMFQLLPSFCLLAFSKFLLTGVTVFRLLPSVVMISLKYFHSAICGFCPEKRSGAWLLSFLPLGFFFFLLLDVLCAVDHP